MLRIRNKNIKPRSKELLKDNWTDNNLDPIEIFQDINYTLFKNELAKKINELEDIKLKLNEKITDNEKLQEDLKILSMENITLESDLSNIKNQNNSYENQINNSINKIEQIEKELIILKKPINPIIYNNKKKASLIQPKKIEIL